MDINAASDTLIALPDEKNHYCKVGWAFIEKSINYTCYENQHSSNLLKLAINFSDIQIALSYMSGASSQSPFLLNIPSRNIHGIFKWDKIDDLYYPDSLSLSSPSSSSSSCVQIGNINQNDLILIEQGKLKGFYNVKL